MQPGDQGVEPESVQQRADQAVQAGQRRHAAARGDDDRRRSTPRRIAAAMRMVPLMVASGEFDGTGLAV